MALLTVGSLFEWLLQSKPSTRVEVVSAACAPPDDVATAIIAMHARKLIAPTRDTEGITWWRRGIAKRQPSLLDQPLASFRSRNSVHPSNWEILCWIDDTVIDAARAWAPRAPRWGFPIPSDAELAQAGIDGEAFLSSRLWRPPADREAALFWREVEGSSPALWWAAPDPTLRRCKTSAECCAGRAPAFPGKCLGPPRRGPGRAKGQD